LEYGGKLNTCQVGAPGILYLKEVKMDRSQNLMVWAYTSIFIGLLPWLVNLITRYIFDDITYFSILRIPDLMFFVIILSITTMIDIFREKFAENIFLIAFLIFILPIFFALLFLGFSLSYNKIGESASIHSDPEQYRLVICSLVNCGLTLVIAFAFQIYIYVKRGSGQQSINDR
jgi:hypothetical protein